MAPLPPTHVELANQPTVTAATTPPASQKTTKPKPKSTPHILHQSTFRHPPFTTFHLTLSSSSPQNTSLDTFQTSQLLTSALTAYLGLTGAAIPIDILKIEGRDVWIRVPKGDARGVRAALGSWVGGKVVWRVLGEGVGIQGDGAEMFG